MFEGDDGRSCFKHLSKVIVGYQVKVMSELKKAIWVERDTKGRICL